MVWWLRKHRPDKRKVPIGPICIRFLYKTVSTGIFLLSGRCFLVNSLGQKNKRPAPIWGPAVCMGHMRNIAKTLRRTADPGPPGSPKIGIFGPKTRGGPCADLPRSYGIIFSSQNRNPTIFVSDFHICPTKNK